MESGQREPQGWTQSTRVGGCIGARWKGANNGPMSTLVDLDWDSNGKWSAHCETRVYEVSGYGKLAGSSEWYPATRQPSWFAAQFVRSGGADERQRRKLELPCSPR